MSKLLKGPGFGQPPTMTITLQHKKEDVLFHITTMILKDGRVDIMGHINDKALGEMIFRDGLARLYQYHEKRTLVSAPDMVTFQETPDA